jgi:hypothetical protein
MVKGLCTNSSAKIYIRNRIKMSSMHFLSHYYVDRDKNNPLFVSGTLLPDIAPHFTRTYNRRIRNKVWQLSVPELSVHRGVLRHYEVDAIFHNSIDFKAACTNASKRLAETGLDREKYRFWFLGHIVVEVLMGRQLILSEPKLLNEYYDVLSSVDTNKLSAYLYLIVTEEEKNKILTNFMNFLEIRFLKYIENMDGAAEGIVRTMLRATGVAFSELDRAKLIIALHNIENDMRYSMKKLLAV